MILNKHIIFVIPAFNEEKTLALVILSLKKYGDIVVIDDCSKDSTPNIAKKMGIFLLQNSNNIGYEKTLIRGLEWAKTKNYKWAITLDADGQHPLSSILKVKETIDKQYDLIIGVRDKFGRMAEYLIAYFFKFKWKIYDPLSGLKAYKLSKIQNFLITYDSFGLKILISLLISKIKVKQVHINVLDRKDTSRLGNLLKVNINMIILLIKIIKENKLN